LSMGGGSAKSGDIGGMVISPPRRWSRLGEALVSWRSVLWKHKAIVLQDALQVPGPAIDVAVDAVQPGELGGRPGAVHVVQVEMVATVQGWEPRAVGEFVGCCLSRSRVGGQSDQAASERSDREAESDHGFLGLMGNQWRGGQCGCGNAFFAASGPGEGVGHGFLRMRWWWDFWWASQHEQARAEQELRFWVAALHWAQVVQSSLQVGVAKRPLRRDPGEEVSIPSQWLSSAMSEADSPDQFSSWAGWRRTSSAGTGEAAVFLMNVSDLLSHADGDWRHRFAGFASALWFSATN